MIKKVKTAEVQVLTLVGHQTQLKCRLMIPLEQQHTVFCLGGRMQSTVQCKDLGLMSEEELLLRRG